MLKITSGRIDLPFTTRCLVQVLVEGRDGGESKVSDKVISDWCYEFCLACQPALEDSIEGLDIDLYRNVALQVSTQWEVDAANCEGRVLSSNQFQIWLDALGEAATGKSL